MKNYSVTVPIAGHAVVTVEAENEKDAEEKALAVVSLDDIECFEGLRSFNSGNVCHCPSPWEISAEEEE